MGLVSLSIMYRIKIEETHETLICMYHKKRDHNSRAMMSLIMRKKKGREIIGVNRMDEMRGSAVDVLLQAKKTTAER